VSTREKAAGNGDEEERESGGGGHQRLRATMGRAKEGDESMGGKHMERTDQE